MKEIKNEYDFLSYMSKTLKMKYIARDLDGQLMVYKDKPLKSRNKWYTIGYLYIDKYPLVSEYEFTKDIKWEDSEPFVIDDFLNK
jgi:hypothetical protein